MHPSCGGPFFTLCKVTRRSRVILAFGRGEIAGGYKLPTFVDLASGIHGHVRISPPVPSPRTVGIK
jgi:hypothetical protein